MRAKPLFAPGTICYPDEMQVVLRQAGVQGIALVCRHLAGDWGDVDEKRRQVNRWVIAHPQDKRKLPLISRFTLSDGRQVAVITRYVYEPARRETTLSLWPPDVKRTAAESRPSCRLKRQPRQEAKVRCGPTKN
ncbi:MAG: hypothetical protein DPW09_03080 [Anaerolineae bacterium]|nr:hypothetical protein [Anaerolineae bacterium]